MKLLRRVVNTADEDGCTPLHYACASSSGKSLLHHKTLYALQFDRFSWTGDTPSYDYNINKRLISPSFVNYTP